MATDDGRLPEPLADNWDWQLEAACRGMDSNLFFHPPNERSRARNRRVAAAKTICGTCVVVECCLEHALLVKEPYGIWGGRSEEERAELLGLSRHHPASAIKKAMGRKE
jgi:WhiB family redox-sensing transcriptional regulator